MTFGSFSSFCPNRLQILSAHKSVFIIILFRKVVQVRSPVEFHDRPRSTPRPKPARDLTLMVNNESKTKSHRCDVLTRVSFYRFDSQKALQRDRPRSSARVHAPGRRDWLKDNRHDTRRLFFSSNFLFGSKLKLQRQKQVVFVSDQRANVWERPFPISPVAAVACSVPVPEACAWTGAGTGSLAKIQTGTRNMLAWAAPSHHFNSAPHQRELKVFALVYCTTFKNTCGE